MVSIIGFLLILCPLVIFHELGHYLFARLFNVKAEVFSIGFGKKVWSKQIGETEWRIALIPMGGFVKLLGEDPEQKLSEEELKRSLPRQAPYKRFFIFFGGPLFNFLFAIVVFMAILAIGEPQLSNVVGRSVRGSAAEVAGFKRGDKIAEVNGVKTTRFEDIANEVADHADKPVQFMVDRGGATVTLSAVPTLQPGFSVYGEPKTVGFIDGLSPMPRGLEIGVSDVASVAYLAGLRTHDELVSFNGLNLKDFEELELAYDQLPAQSPMILKIKSAEKKSVIELKATKPGIDTRLAAVFGIHSSELFIDRVVSGSPAEAAGLKSGDRLIGVGTHVVESFIELREWVQKSGEKDGKVHVVWERDGKQMLADITPTATNVDDPVMKKVVQYTIGVVPVLSWGQPDTFVERVLNPFTLLYKGTERMLLFTWRNVVSIGKMFTGDVSVKTLGGPILIGKLAGESIGKGLISFLTMMAVLSVGLGILNILPVPVLDGGHLMLLTLEIIRGKPLTLRQMEIVQQVGLSMILLLMVVVMKNDISRLAIFN